MCRIPRRLLLATLLAAMLTADACRKGPPVREFTVVGQIVAIDRTTNYVTLRHEDIKGFMPGMTMPFAVKDATVLEGRTPGDLVTATLRVQNTDAWIARLTKTGTAPLPEASARPAPGLAPGDRVGDQVFIDQDGRALTLDWLQGHVAVVTFVYTRCPLPDFCPAIDRRFVDVQKAIKSRTAPLDARLLSITIDPAFDSPAVLKAHAQKLGADSAVWRFATAPADELARFGRQFGLDVKPGSGPADIEHNLRTVVLDRDRRIVEVRTATTWSAADLVLALRKVAGA